jgi:predicted nucleotidyltransferase
MIQATAAELAIVRSLLERNVPGIAVWAFGSRVDGTAKPHSDLDLVLLARDPVPLATLALLEDDFAESDLPYRVDVVDWTRLDESFRQVIGGRHEAVKEA